MTEQPMQGGYRRPSSPAPVSGPGAMSRRTDGQGARYMSGGEYGEGQEMMDLQTSAPMSDSKMRPRRSPGRAASARRTGMSGVTPLFSPTERPDEPLTAGASFGPGPGPADEMLRPSPNNRMIIEKYLPAMRDAAMMEGAPDRFRALVRYLQGSLLT